MLAERWEDYFRENRHHLDKFLDDPVEKALDLSLQ